MKEAANRAPGAEKYKVGTKLVSICARGCMKFGDSCIVDEIRSGSKFYVKTSDGLNGDWYRLDEMDVYFSMQAQDGKFGASVKTTELKVGDIAYFYKQPGDPPLQDGTRGTVTHIGNHVDYVSFKVDDGGNIYSVKRGSLRTPGELEDVFRAGTRLDCIRGRGRIKYGKLCVVTQRVNMAFGIHVRPVDGGEGEWFRLAEMLLHFRLRPTAETAPPDQATDKNAEHGNLRKLIVNVANAHLGDLMNNIEDAERNLNLKHSELIDAEEKVVDLRKLIAEAREDIALLNKLFKSREKKSVKRRG